MNSQSKFEKDSQQILHNLSVHVYCTHGFFVKSMQQRCRIVFYKADHQAETLFLTNIVKLELEFSWNSLSQVKFVPILCNQSLSLPPIFQNPRPMKWGTFVSPSLTSSNFTLRECCTSKDSSFDVESICTQQISIALKMFTKAKLHSKYDPQFS